jgi:hypothetical protein
VLGVEGVGKTTFGAGFPSPVFLAAEEGVWHVDVPAYPEPKSAQDIDDALDDLISTPSDYRTLVIDTVDWAEPMLASRLCKRNGWQDIESPGYGKGQLALVDEWRTLLAKLDRMRSERGIEVLMLAHAAVKGFANPSGPDYSRYELALTKGASALIKQWCDVVMFATFEDILVNQKGETVTGAAFSKTKVKGLSTGRRILHTVRTAAWDAKARIALPPVIALDAAEYMRARAKGLDVDVGEVLAACLSLVASLKLDESSVSYINGLKDDPQEAVLALNRLRVKAAEAGIEV